MITPMTEIKKVDDESLINPISSCIEELSSVVDLKNMAFEIITNKRRTISVVNL